MSGTGQYLTPTFSGKVLFSLTGFMTNNTANQGAQARLKWGTGTKPTLNSIPAGTQIGGIISETFYAANALTPASLVAIVSGLSVGTRYWFDFSYGTGGSTGTAKLMSMAMCAVEIP